MNFCIKNGTTHSEFNLWLCSFWLLLHSVKVLCDAPFCIKNGTTHSEFNNLWLLIFWLLVNCYWWRDFNFQRNTMTCFFFVVNLKKSVSKHLKIYISVLLIKSPAWRSSYIGRKLWFSIYSLALEIRVDKMNFWCHSKIFFLLARHSFSFCHLTREKAKGSIENST